MTGLKREKYAGSTAIQTLLSDCGSGGGTYQQWKTFGGRSSRIAVEGYDLSLFYTHGHYGLGDGNYGQMYGSVYAIFNDGTSRKLYDEFSYGPQQGFSSVYYTGPHYVINYLTANEQKLIKELQIIGYASVCWTDKNTRHSGDNGVELGMYLCGRRIPWVIE